MNYRALFFAVALSLPVRSEPLSLEERADVVLRVMLKQPQAVRDRADGPEARADLYRPLAHAIASATRNLNLVVALMAQSYYETKWARYVLEGRCKDGPPGERCDWSSVMKAPLARGPWQVHRWCRAAWDTDDGSPESYEASAACQLRLLKQHYAACKTWEGAFAGSWRGSCSSPTAKARAALMQEMLADLQREYVAKKKTRTE
jgi:hypothetical protein